MILILQHLEQLLSQEANSGQGTANFQRVIHIEGQDEEEKVPIILIRRPGFVVPKKGVSAGIRSLLANFKSDGKLAEKYCVKIIKIVVPYALTKW